MKERTIVEFRNNSDTSREIVRLTDRLDCSRIKRHHRGKKRSKDAIVKDFALSHYTAEYCKNERFSLKKVEAIMKECLTVVGAHTTINATNYKKLKKIVFESVPYSDWFNIESFPTILKLI